MPEPLAEITYRPAGPTIRRFHESNAFVRGIMGPIGSAKTTACCVEVLRRAAQQAPGPDGVRRSRWAIIRNSRPELLSTTVKTWEMWAPLSAGRFSQDSPITHHIKTEDMDCEVLFLGLDDEGDVRKLLSLELTGAVVSEARQVPRAIIDALTGRVGRYPPQRDGGATWSGLILETNPPDRDSWWYKLAEEETPEGWEFFKQPSGLSPEAENLENLPEGYYRRAGAGKDPDWIAVFIHGEYGYVIEGKPVFPMWRDRTHVAPEPLRPIANVPLLLGVDFGLTPAAVIGQRAADGRWLILDEICTEDTGTIRFAELLVAHLTRHYPDHDWEGWGDPAGNQRAQTDERTALEIMKEYTGHRWNPAPSNDWTMRREVVAGALNRMVDGDPGLLVSPTCSVLRKGFAGGYHYKRVRTGSGDAYHDRPEKNAYSHPMDGLQYLLLGGGEHHVVMRRERRRGERPAFAVTEYDELKGLPRTQKAPAVPWNGHAYRPGRGRREPIVLT